MLRCKKCHISLIGRHNSCPLCQGDVTGEPVPNNSTFPIIPMDHTRNTLLKTVTSGMIILSIVCLAIGVMFPEARGWSFIIFAAMLSLWISFYFVMKNMKKVCKNIFFQVVILWVLTSMWVNYNGYHQWSITYVFPIMITCSIIAIYIIAVKQKMNVADYAQYLIMSSIFGIVGFRYLSSSETTISIPMLICFAVSIIAIILLLLFRYKAIWSEIRRWLYF